jgi:hypothetical protein
MLRRHALGTALLGAAVAATSACQVTIDDKPQRFFAVQNDTAEAIVVFIEGLPETDPARRAEVAAHGSWSRYQYKCGGTAVVATDAAHREIARLPHACEADTWSFHADGTVSLTNVTGAPAPTGAATPPDQRPVYPAWWAPTPTPPPSRVPTDPHCSPTC